MIPVQEDPYSTKPTEPLQTPPPVIRQLSFKGLTDTKDAQASHPEDTLSATKVTQALSLSNVKKRVERLFKPNADGTFKVPKELLEEWKSGDKQKLIREFQSCGLDKENHAKTRSLKNRLFGMLFVFRKVFKYMEYILLTTAVWQGETTT